MRADAQFEYDFVVEGKAVEDPDDGSLIVEGYATGFKEDRQNEAFEPGAFEEGMKAYMAKNPVILYHHKKDFALGHMLEYENRAQGTWVKGVLDKPEPMTPAADVFNKVKSGTIRGWSVGGIFHRHRTPKGPRIHTADVMEMSLTPLPVESNSLVQVAGKAFSDDPDPDLTARVDRIDKLSAIFDRIIEGKAVSAAYRAKAKAAGHTLPGTDKYPIESEKDVKDAVRLVGNSSEDKSKVIAHIKKEAARIGCTSCVPSDW